MINLEIVEKFVKKIDIEDLTIEFLVDYYIRNQGHEDYVLLVYDNLDYQAAFTSNNAFSCVDQVQVIENLSNLYHGAILEDDIDKVDIQNKISLVTDLILVLGSENENTALFLQYKSPDRSKVAHLRSRIKDKLCEQGVNAWLCKIPQGAPLFKKNLNFSLHVRLAWADCYRKELESVLSGFTENDYETEKSAILAEREKEGILPSEKPIIYLVGPCIVDGVCVSEGERLVDILKDYTKGMYNIKRVTEYNNRLICYTSILGYTIRKCDIVIFLDYFPDNINVDLDMTKVFMNYKGKKNLYMDVPLHTTRWGNELIAAQILTEIVVPHETGLNINGGGYTEVLHMEEPFQLTYGVNEELETYLQKIQDIVQDRRKEEVRGAIVMNANPFTLGHRYLVEYAAEKVDLLFLFVVEEDASEIPFEVRKKLVEMGTADIKNVVVIPSGSFIISRATFISYFEKGEIQDEKIDASYDCRIFAKYIAPGLGISKRFVGEEPTDLVTRQYNEQMTEIFSKYGLELVEITRKQNNGKAISATTVRALYHEKEWDTLRKLVPDTTFVCLYKQNGSAWERDEAQVMQKKGLEVILEIREKQREGFKLLYKFLKEASRVIIYGIGHDSAFLYNQLPEILSDNKIEFCDRKAATGEIFFHNKRVISPEDIKTDDFVFITTTRYKEEIYRTLLKKGIDKNRIGILEDNFINSIHSEADIGDIGNDRSGNT